DPYTSAYMQYSASSDFSDLGTSRAGVDFFEDSHREIVNSIVPDDLDYFLEEFTKEKVLEKTEKGEIFILNYRLVFANRPEKICLRAGIVREKDGPQLIVGVSKVSD
ncbi:MAG: hypothetical protein IKQ40_01590, partial [Lachnospiraceae bacterium]|nr:hypothetical protein [Lachnospiraceae bacterium]